MINHLIQEIVFEHAEELSALWINANPKIQFQYDFNFTSLYDREDRIEAHLDGLLLDPDIGWEKSIEALKLGEAGELYAASLVAMSSGNKEYINEVGKIAIENPEMTQGFLDALLWFPIGTVKAIVDSLLKAKLPVAQSLGVVALAYNGVDPASALQPLFNSDDKLVQIRAADAAGMIGRVDLLSSLHKLLNHEDMDIRFTAARSAAMLGSQAAAKVLIDFVKLEDYRQQAMERAIPLMSPNNAQYWLNELAKDTAYTRYVIFGTGVLGDPQNISGLIRAMAHKDFARIAGNAFSLITGIDLDDLGLTLDYVDENALADQPAGDADDNQSDDIANAFDDDEPDPDEIYPWPDPNKIAAWWQSKQHHFKPGQRYLMGLPITEPDLLTVLAEGNQQHRNAAALELKLRRPNLPLFNTNARVKMQLSRLKELEQMFQPAIERAV